MRKEDVLKMMRNPKFIPGIYLYCDYWCEHCRLAARCANYALEQAQHKTASPHLRGSGRPRPIELARRRFESALSLVHQLPGAPLRGKETQAQSRSNTAGRPLSERKRTSARRHPLVQSALAYSHLVSAWFRTGEHALRDKEEEILAQAKLGVAGINEEVADLTEVVETARWYQAQIFRSLLRAWQQTSDAKGRSKPSSDPAGVAKVALIAIDRSINSWLRLKEYFPEREDSILTVLIQLDRLRRDTEQSFPEARSFVRPGFDEVEEKLR